MHTDTAPESDNPSPEAAALQRAVSIVGSQSAFGRLLGRNQSSVHDWLKGMKPLPAEHVLKVEAETGISRHALRPDLYPRDPAAEAATALDIAAPRREAHPDVGGMEPAR